MSITSFYFLLFYALVLLIYYIVPKKGQWVILLLASLLYYFFRTTASSFLSAFRRAGLPGGNLADGRSESGRRREGAGEDPGAEEGRRSPP